jgi:glycogen(starch) synthase
MLDRPSDKRLRALYALGPGNVVNSYEHWKRGEDVLSETSRTYSGQFFDFCQWSGHRGYAISSFGDATKVDDGAMIVENRPKRIAGGRIWYHVAQLSYAMSIMITAIRWRADVVLVDSGTTHWVFLSLLRLANIKLVGILHNVAWPVGHKPQSFTKKLILASDGWFWRHIADAVISVSPACERQVRELARNDRIMAVQCRAQFRRSDFAGIPAVPALGGGPMRVVFAGRIEVSKGALDIVEIAKLLESRHPGRVRFDVCGTGSALPALRSAIQNCAFEEVIQLHGKLLRPELLKIYASSHIFIVPTRTDFLEGMAMVAIEGILCGRPVVASSVVPACEVLQGAVLVATPDDPQSYADAVVKLLEDPIYYERLRAACSSLQEQFYDPNTSLTAAFERVFNKLIP